MAKPRITTHENVLHAITTLENEGQGVTMKRIQDLLEHRFGVRGNPNDIQGHLVKWREQHQSKLKESAPSHLHPLLAYFEGCYQELVSLASKSVEAREQSLDSAMNELKIEMEALSHVNEAQKALIEELDGANQELHQFNDEKVSLINDLHSTLSGVQAALEKTLENEAYLKLEKQNLEDRYSKLGIDHELQIERLEAKHTAVVDDLFARIASVESERYDCKNNSAKLSSELDKKSAQLTEVKTKLDLFTATNETNRQEVMTLRDEVNAFKAEHDNLKQYNEALKLQSDLDKQKITNFTIQVDKYEDRERENNQKLETLQSLHQSELNKTADELRSLENQLAAETSKNQTLQETIDKLIASQGGK